MPEKKMMRIKVGRNSIEIQFTRVERCETEGLEGYTFYLHNKEQARYYKVKTGVPHATLKANSVRYHLPIIGGKRLERKIQNYI